MCGSRPFHFSKVEKGDIVTGFNCLFSSEVIVHASTILKRLWNETLHPTASFVLTSTSHYNLWTGEVKFFQEKHFFSLSLSMEKIFKHCFFLLTIFFNYQQFFAFVINITPFIHLFLIGQGRRWYCIGCWSKRG